MSNASPPAPASGQHGPLGPLALALSGGGYRAAAFHLGTLRFLDGVGLLPDVVGLSTVSGGTITGMAWVTSQLDGKTFPDFYTSYSAYLKRTNVIAEALQELTSDRDPVSHCWSSLIQSAAQVYASDELFGDRRFGSVLGASGLQLQEAIFNTTEFHTGLDFRFRRSTNPHTLLGNNNYELPRSVAQHVRLADVVAASSCFPGGFEPLLFPQQFDWPQAFPLPSALNELGPGFDRGLPLMDGGIYDNQGVDSLLLAFAESPHPPTLLISDVSTKSSEMYNVPENPTKRGWVTLNGVMWMGAALLLLTVASALLLGWRAFDTARSGAWGAGDALVYLVPGLLTAAVAVTLGWLYGRAKDVNKLLREQVEFDAWASFRKLTVMELVQLLVLRVTSVLALTSSIFMKRVRELVINRVYQDARFQGRRMGSFIDSLTRHHPGLFSKHPWLQPQPHLVQRAQQACQMPTTLWFADDAQFAAVESAGEATACFVLLRHIVEDRAGQYESEGQPLHALYLRLREAWDGFNQQSTPAEAERRVAA